MITINIIRRIPDMKKFRERVFRGDLMNKDGLRKSTHFILVMKFFGITDALTLVSTIGMHSLGDDRNGLQRQRKHQEKIVPGLVQFFSENFRVFVRYS